MIWYWEAAAPLHSTYIDASNPPPHVCLWEGFHLKRSVRDAAALLTGAEEIPSPIFSRWRGQQAHCMLIRGSEDNRWRRLLPWFTAEAPTLRRWSASPLQPQMQETTFSPLPLKSTQGKQHWWMEIDHGAVFCHCFFFLSPVWCLTSRSC